MSQPASKAAPVASAATRREDDLYTWVQEQVALLMAGRLDEIDTENLAEELRDVGAAQYARLESALRVLVMHMLKWDHQPEKRSRSWVFSIREQRRRYEKLIRVNPGLKPHGDTALADMYPSARDAAAQETDCQPGDFPDICPYGWEDLLDRPFEMDA